MTSKEQQAEIKLKRQLTEIMDEEINVKKKQSLKIWWRKRKTK